jgi:hypothetical protein
VSAFKGQDVVISSVPNPKFVTEKIWMDAAISAGVRRIVPSEFSSNLETKLSQDLPIVKEKVQIRKYIEEISTAGKIEWSSINNGAFMVPFIWLSGWMGPSPKNKVTNLHDGGEKIVCSSTLTRIAEGVARSLLPQNVEYTKNKPIYVYSAAISEKKMTAIVEKIMGVKFEEKDNSIEAVTKDAFASFEKGDMSKMMSFYIPFCFGDGYGGDFRSEASNEKLGLKEMTDEELEATVRGWLKEAEAL